MHFPVGEDSPRAQAWRVRQDHPQAEREPQRPSGHYLRQRGRHQVSVAAPAGVQSAPRASSVTLHRPPRFLNQAFSGMNDADDVYGLGTLTPGLHLQPALKCPSSPMRAKNMIT